MIAGFDGGRRRVFSPSIIQSESKAKYNLISSLKIETDDRLTTINGMYFKIFFSFSVCIQNLNKCKKNLPSLKESRCSFLSKDVEYFTNKCDLE